MWLGSGAISQGLPRVEELLEARAPKGQAYITETAGVVDIWEDGDKHVIQVTPQSGKTERIALEGRILQIKGGSDVKTGDVIASLDGAKPLIAPFDGVVEEAADTVVIVANATSPVRYEIPNVASLTVEKNDVVAAGDRLTIGSLNLHDLMALKGIEATQRYIMNEILRIYAAQGQRYRKQAPRYIIVRQMFSRVQIEDAGDGEFVTGDTVSKASVVEANKQLASEGKKLIAFKQMLLGITKVSIYSDSFLSAASFQNTTHVLIGAATSGRIDRLHGLKENVIIGRKIPVGTGARTNQVAEDQQDDEE